MTCSHCGSALPQGAMFCGECGRAVTAAQQPGRQPGQQPGQSIARPVVPFDPPAAVRCEACGARMSPDDIFCGDCGTIARSYTEPVAVSRDTAMLPLIGTGLPRLEGDPWNGQRRDEIGAPPADEADDIEITRIVPRRPSGESYVLQFSTGENVTVTGSGLIGRRPSPQPGEHFDHLVTVDDPDRSVSKTHLEFGQDGGALWVADRYSGNGSVLRAPNSPPRLFEPGRRYRVTRGTRIDIGEQFLIIS